MADYKVTDSQLTGIADAIRTKGGTSSQLEFPTGFVSAVQALPESASLGTKTVTGNGTYQASSDSLDGYSSFTVNVPSFDSEAF